MHVKTVTVTPRAAPTTTIHRAQRRQPWYPNATSASVTMTCMVQQSAFALPESCFQALQVLTFPAVVALVWFT